MSSKNDLAVQLAEVAAGQRDRVDENTLYFAAREELQRNSALREAAEEQAHAARDHAEAAREQAEAARETLAWTQYAIERQQAHQQEMQAAAAEQTRVLAVAAEKKLKFEQSAHAERMRIDQERHDKELEERRLQTSASYSSAKKVAELREIERFVREEEQIEDLLRSAKSLWHDLEKAVQRSDADAFTAATAAASTIEVAHTQAETRRAASRAEATRVLNTLEAKLKETTQELKSSGPGLAPSTWMGKAAEKRRELNERCASLKGRIGEQNNKIAKLSMPLPKEAVDRVTLTRSRRSRVLEVCEVNRSSINHLEQKIVTWVETGSRSAEAVSLLTGRQQSSSPFEIDYKLCLMLDHARASAAPVVYEGLGVLPFGPELVKAATKIKELRKSLPGFCSGGSAPDGFFELQWIRDAARTGRVPFADDINPQDEPKSGSRLPSLTAQPTELKPVNVLAMVAALPVEKVAIDRKAGRDSAVKSPTNAVAIKENVGLFDSRYQEYYKGTKST